MGQRKRRHEEKKECATKKSEISIQKKKGATTNRDASKQNRMGHLMGQRKRRRHEKRKRV